jgi:hypothetical protein
MRAAIIEAHHMLLSLRQGDPVQVRSDGRYLAVTVQREIHSADPGGFGSTESRRITVGFGPGRWNREVTVEALANDPSLLTRGRS